MAFEGTLSDINLSVVLQMIGLGEKTTAFQVEHGDKKGLIVIDKGRVVHARLGDVEGKEACYEMMSWKRGHFKSFEILSTPEHSINISADHLALEAAKWIDDHRRDGELSKTMHHGLDVELAGKLFMLYSVLEQHMERLKAPKLKKRPHKFLKQIEPLLSEVVGFLFTYSERYQFEEHLIDKAVDSVGLIYPPVKLVEVTRERANLGTAILFLVNWQGSKEDRQDLLNQLNQGLGELLHSYFSLLASSFGSQSASIEWLETSKVFLEDFQATASGVSY